MGAKASKALINAVDNPNDIAASQNAFDMFDRDKNSMITKKEFLEMTKILLNENKLQNTQNKKVDKFSAELFDEYDKNHDGILTFEDFRKFVIGITSKNNGAAAPVMNKRVMDFYLNYAVRDKDGTLKVVNLPSEWIQLFKASGVKPKELKDPETVVFLLDTMDKSLKEVNSGTSLPPAPSRNDPLSSGPRGTAPPPPSNIPAPPPPPPGPPPPGPAPTVAKTQKKKEGGGAPPPPKKDVFAEIREGKKLKPAEDRELDELDDDQKNTLASMMNQAMVARRGAIQVAQDDDDDDWDDWE